MWVRDGPVYVSTIQTQRKKKGVHVSMGVYMCVQYMFKSCPRVRSWT